MVFYLLLLCVSQSIINHQSVSMNSLKFKQRYVFLSRFGCHPGDCTTSVSMKFRKPWDVTNIVSAVSFEIGLKPDHMKENEIKKMTCEERRSFFNLDQNKSCNKPLMSPSMVPCLNL